MTRESDVDLALELGADYCGFIVYPKSPRGITIERASELARRVPEGRRVLVDVESGAEELEQYREAGFDYFQIHARAEMGLVSLAAWAGLVGRDRLWLAPKLPPGEGISEMLPEFAQTILLDAFHRDKFGGTGQTGDWAGFARLREEWPQLNWVLAGGLGPDNVLDALAATGAEQIDINSGVETEPGVKDPAKLRELFRRVKPD